MVIKIFNLEITFVFKVVTINKKRRREIERFNTNILKLEQWHRSFDNYVEVFQRKGRRLDTAYLSARRAVDDPFWLKH